MDPGAGGGRWDPPWRQEQSEPVGGAYREPPTGPSVDRGRRGQGPWGDPREWDAAFMVPQRRPEPPAVLRTATALMLVGAGLTIVSTVVFFATTDQYAEALSEVSGLSDAGIDRAVDEARAREIFQTALGVGLWVWMAVKNGDGRRWARVVATVFGVINAFGFVLGGAVLTGFDSADLVEYLLPQFVLGALSVVLGIVILVQLYQPASSQFYDESTRYQAALTLRGYR